MQGHRTGASYGSAVHMAGLRRCDCRAARAGVHRAPRQTVAGLNLPSPTSPLVRRSGTSVLDSACLPACARLASRRFGSRGRPGRLGVQWLPELGFTDETTILISGRYLEYSVPWGVSVVLGNLPAWPGARRLRRISKRKSNCSRARRFSRVPFAISRQAVGARDLANAA
jgi:hypothetical protein